MTSASYGSLTSLTIAALSSDGSVAGPAVSRFLSPVNLPPLGALYQKKLLFFLGIFRVQITMHLQLARPRMLLIVLIALSHGAR